jgi:hypothetical protein
MTAGCAPAPAATRTATATNPTGMSWVRAGNHPANEHVHPMRMAGSQSQRPLLTLPAVPMEVPETQACPRGHAPRGTGQRPATVTDIPALCKLSSTWPSVSPETWAFPRPGGHHALAATTSLPPPRMHHPHPHPTMPTPPTPTRPGPQRPPTPVPRRLAGHLTASPSRRTLVPLHPTPPLARHPLQYRGRPDPRPRNRHRRMPALQQCPPPQPLTGGEGSDGPATPGRPLSVRLGRPSGGRR